MAQLRRLGEAGLAPEDDVLSLEAFRAVKASVRALPGRLSGLSVPKIMKIHSVWGFCMGAQGA
jgi:hypothetical protein